MNKSITEAFGQALAEIGEDERIVVLDADLAKATKSIRFKEKYPDRFFDMGIAEQDMIGTAAGLASCGKIPFACSFAVFITGNAYSQIRSACISGLNIKYVGTHGGIATGEDGGSHQALEDINIMRALPNMTIIQPCDAEETYQATKAIAYHPGSVYLRLIRGELPIIFNSNYQFEIGKAEILRNGKDLTIFATGTLVHEALEAADLLSKKLVEATVVNISTIRPIDPEITKFIIETDFIVSCEDHNIIGGLGSAIDESLAGDFLYQHLRIGINNQFGHSGSKKDLYDRFGLSAKRIKEKILKYF